MKTVSGELVSTKPISLSRAANYLSKFVNSDNGASQSVSAYLRRASTAFNEVTYVNTHRRFKKHRLKEAGSIDLNINPKISEENEFRVLESSYENRKFVDNSIEGKLRRRQQTKIEEDNVTVNQKSEETKNIRSNYSILEKKKKRRRTKTDD